MKKNEAQLKQRRKFAKNALQNPKKAAAELRVLAEGLENCRTTSDVVIALSTIFAVSEQTIFKDLQTF